MIRTTRAGCLRAAAAVTAAAVAGLTALPAYAAEAPSLKVELTGKVTLAGPDSAGKASFAWITGTAATNVTATFEFAGVARVATALPSPSQCKTSGTKAIC